MENALMRKESNGDRNREIEGTLDTNWLEIITAEVWEEAFLDAVRMDDLDCDAIAAAACRTNSVMTRVQLDELKDDSESVVRDVLKALEIATVGIEFPDSMHSDVVWAHISLFPRRTAIGLIRGCLGLERVVVVRDATADSVEWAVRDAIHDMHEGADWAEYEEDEEAPEDQDGDLAGWFGFAALEEKLKPAPKIQAPRLILQRWRRVAVRP